MSSYLLLIDENPVTGHDLFTVSVPEDPVDPRVGLDQAFQNDSLTFPTKN